MQNDPKDTLARLSEELLAQPPITFGIKSVYSVCII